MSSPIADTQLQNQPQPAINGGQQSSPTTTEQYKHQATPIRKPTRKPPPPADPLPGDDRSVSCNKCRPGSRDKISVNPIDIPTTNNGGAAPKSSTNYPHHSSPNNNGLFRSILSSLTRKSPKSSSDNSSSSSTKEEQWKLTMAELSQKLVQATRKRDEALLESSRLKHSMAELEKKLNKLEVYCRNLKSGLEVCSSSSNNSPLNQLPTKHNLQTNQRHYLSSERFVVEAFLTSISEARSAVRLLSRSLTLQLRQMGGGMGKVFDRVTILVQPYEGNGNAGSSLKNSRTLMCYLEAMLNKALHEDFETNGFQKNSTDNVLNPLQRCELNYSSYESLQGLTWEEVLSKGTRHFSEEFSGFCDRKMSEIVAMLGWNRAWPEPLLQAFFSAAKAVWLEHLLACSVHPRLQIFRVDKEVKFDGLYMEDMSGDRAQRLVAETVRIMVAPGFYVDNNVVKCKVLCRYSNNRNQGSPTTTTIAPSSTTAKATTSTT
ncbi:hypothetical protein Sjap_020842 [Stephania japonica]|uniref:GIL1/IRKI C-terminal domain-containing protein n=1 Tax=Stephania japonica TaxID=461633 RepID=A0AAP0HVX9_9MAGN